MNPPGYASITTFPRYNPQPPIKAPPPLPPQGVTRPVIGAPVLKAGPSQAPLIAQPFIRIYNSIFGD